MKTICAICKVHLSGDPADPRTSHGLCLNCFNEQLRRFHERLAERQGKLRKEHDATV